MGPISLDHSAPWQDIAHCIKASQRRCRTGLVQDEIKLAKEVSAQVLRLQLVAMELGVDVVKLFLKGQCFEESTWRGGVTTLVEISRHGLTVKRAEPHQPAGVLVIAIPRAVQP